MNNATASASVVTSKGISSSVVSPPPPTSSSRFGLTNSDQLLRLYQEPTWMRRIFFFSAPIALAIISVDRFVDVPWFIDVSVCLLISFLLAFRHFFTSRVACAFRLSAGEFVVNLNAEIHPGKPIVLYDRHSDAGCTVVRECLCMLGMDIELRSCPEPVDGISTPWYDQLAIICNRNHIPVQPPFIIMPDVPIELQGNGFALTKYLLGKYSLDPKETFPLDLDEKVTRKLCGFATSVRAYLPWGIRSMRVSWDKLNEIRHQLNVAAGFVSSNDSSNDSFTAAGNSSPQLKPDGTISSLSLNSSSAVSISPSSDIATVSESALRTRLHMQRQAAFRAGSGNNSAASLITDPSKRHFSVEEVMTPVSSHADLQSLVLYGTINSPACRPVFELCYSLQLPLLVHTCAQGSVNRAKLLHEYGDHYTLPTLMDPNTRKVLCGVIPAVEHLLRCYTD